ncbi:RTC4-like domain-containing protein [Microdochium trichocladiopsis]|uniref:Restriction of telomere capping protein 4 n=1 Tax=Microdochium trichocladiopsis TaxID=1682393 RepID=A0A9P8YB69_9PEZI|nr:RTC4-like domain-containing protein [Microdochium trichocladiopsis]KAH7034839.1 RTC4-like domain-containing protein [Microdochium trichocladiopsis]
MEDLKDVPPPEASSDEDDLSEFLGGTSQSAKKNTELYTSEDENDDYNKRREVSKIKPSTFVSRAREHALPRMFNAQGTRGTATQPRSVASGQPNRKPKEELGDSFDSGPSQGRANNPQANQFVDQNGFTKTQTAKIRRPGDKIARTLKRSYSAKEMARERKAAAEKQGSTSQSTSPPASPVMSRLKIPHASISPEPASPKAGFKRGPSALDDQDHSPDKKSLRGPRRKVDWDSPEMPTRFRLPELVKDSDDKTMNKGDPVGEEFSQLPALRFPVTQDGSDDELLSLTAASNTTRPLEDPVASSYTLDDDLSDAEDASGTARCPMCRAQVDPALLKKHAGVHPMSVRQQTAFCRLHQRKEASRTAAYPEVDWGHMEQRLKDHRRFLKKILEGREASHYADKFQDKLKDKMQRTLFKSGDALTPGYFGPRGLRLMTEFIVRDLGDVLRRRAVEDMLVSSRGHTRYVQSVLVPELAVCLIMEDMSLSVKEARVVLEESKSVGELLNEDVGDVVFDVVSDLDD